MEAFELDIEVEIASEPRSRAGRRAPRPEDARPARASGNLGRYALRGEIASGGMATVHLAVARGSGGFERVLAVKRIHPHLAREHEFVEMFMDEARIASRIQHPNVCAVVDFGRAEDGYFLAMEHLSGRPLTKVLQALGGRDVAVRAHRRPLLAARIVADACEGLHAAHELCDRDGRPLDVVHRDVSPHNLFVTWDGIVKVVDFGIATAQGRLHHTATGLVKGKFAYMAPEQLGDCGVDRRADIWSLGVVLWEMLAGRHLFKRKMESDTIMAVTRDPIPALGGVRPGVPHELEAIVSRALSRDLAHRYATARDMGRALNRWLAKQPEPLDAAELSDWMRALFPGGRRRQREQLRVALASGRREARPGGSVTSAEARSRSAVVRRGGAGRRHRSLWLAVAAAAAVAAGVPVGWSVGQGARAGDGGGDAESSPGRVASRGGAAAPVGRVDGRPGGLTVAPARPAAARPRTPDTTATGPRLRRPIAAAVPPEAGEHSSATDDAGADLEGQTARQRRRDRRRARRRHRSPAP